MKTFNRTRIYSNQDSIAREVAFDDRKNKVGSDRIVPLPKPEKYQRPKLTNLIKHALKQMIV